jgi:uroporphyrinogen-III decarboxylase
MAEMTSRERLWAALHSQETDRMPWAPLMDGYFTSSLPKQGHPDDLLYAAEYIGCDLLERHVAGPEEILSGVQVREEKNAAGSRVYYETPVGTAFVERKNSGKTSYVSKHMVESIEDAKIYQYIAEHTSYRPRIQEFLAREKQIGERGMATLSGNMSPVQETLQFLGGVENTVYLMADYPEEMDALFEAMQERNKRQYQALLEYPCGVIIDYEDTSTTVMSRSMFVDYSLPAINQYADLCHQAGKLYITHMCGKLTGFVKEIGSGRQDGVDSVCPPFTGDLCAWDARAAWGESKLVIGGIDPPRLSMVSQTEAAQMAVEVIRKLENKRGFLLSTGDAVAHDTPIGNLKIIADMIQALGAGSLSQNPDPEIVDRFLK